MLSTGVNRVTRGDKVGFLGGNLCNFQSMKFNEIQFLMKSSDSCIFRSSIEHHHNSKNSSSSIPSDSAKESIANDKKKPHIKKPLNAFMLYMKEMRAQVNSDIH